MKTSIVKTIAKILLPFIQVFGAYVVVFGHISPGGGFAGGSIIGASLILYRFVYGNEKALNKFKFEHLMKLTSIALIVYGLLKGSVFVQSFFHMDGFIPVGIPGNVLSGGMIMPLNILVGAVVAITFYFIATLFEEGEIEYAEFAE